MKICAGIVSYNPDDISLIRTVESVINQVEKIYIVDNGSKDIDSIINMLKRHPNVVLRALDKNYGIAFALNTICGMASSDEFDWVLTLDQDTECPTNLIEELVECSKGLKHIGIVCPAVYYKGLNKKNVSRERVEFVKACMTSGSLTSLEAYKTVEGFDNGMFIDLVDNDFCQKLAMHNFTILRVNSTIIQHELGSSRTVKILGFIKKNLTYHHPKRAYYIARNYCYYIKKHGKHMNVLLEKIKMHYVLFLEYVGSIDRKATKKYIKMGFRDAKEGKMGELKENDV